MFRKNKYNNNGHGTSDKEKSRGATLVLMERAGLISYLKKQVTYELIPAQWDVVEGKKICLERACKYIADFVYFDNKLQQQVVEDSKGCKTDVYKIKKKLMLKVHGIKIKET